jgi:hypothetical protein
MRESERSVGPGASIGQSALTALCCDKEEIGPPLLAEHDFHEHNFRAPASDMLTPYACFTLEILSHQRPLLTRLCDRSVRPAGSNVVSRPKGILSTRIYSI